MIASVCVDPRRVKRRHATVTAPVFGSIAIVTPWLIDPSAALRRTGVLQVTPQFTEYWNMMSDLSVEPEPVNAAYATYTGPAGRLCVSVTVVGCPPGDAGGLMIVVVTGHVRLSRGMSTASHGLSSSRVPGSDATIDVLRNENGSRFSRLLSSMNRERNTALEPFAWRLKARPK